MHAAVLFAIGVESRHPVVAIQIRHPVHQPGTFQGQPAQDAVKGQHHQRWAGQRVQRVGKALRHILGPAKGQDGARIDGRHQRQPAIIGDGADRADMMPAPHAQKQRVAGEFCGGQRRAGQPGQPGIFIGSGFCVQFQNAAAFGDGCGDDGAGRGRAEMGECHLADGQVCFDQQKDRDIRLHHPLPQQRGHLKIQPVARRSAQHRDRGQRRVQRGDQRVLLPGQPVDQQQAEQAAIGIMAETARHRPQAGHPARDRQRRQIGQNQGCGAEMTGGKADRHDTVRGIALRPDFPGGRASGDHATLGQSRCQRLGKGRQFIALGPEQQHHGGMGAAQAVQQGGDQIGPAAVGLHSDRSGCALLRSRSGVHQPASNSRIELASSTACVRRRALILDMIAVICVLTVASAMDSS
ncbi:hypothetical protein PANO111632_11965 [Paracoccus nototheniae]